MSGVLTSPATVSFTGGNSYDVYGFIDVDNSLASGDIVAVDLVLMSHRIGGMAARASASHSTAIAEWDALALAERAGAKIAEKWGDTSSYEVRARIAERTAEALRIQEKTGVAVCSCCHKPLSETGYDDGR